MTNSVDIVANSISLIQPDGSLQTLTIGGTIAPVNDPIFTGTVQGVTKGQIGLGNVDNTSDLNKPISIATQNALNSVIANTNASLTSHLVMINDNTSGVTSLNTSVNTIKSQITSLNTSVFNNTSGVTSLNTSVINNTSGVTSLNTSVNNINSTLTTQLNLINSNGNSITSLNSSVLDNTSGVTSLNTSVVKLNSNITNINSTLTSQLNLINLNSNNISSLVTSTNLTFASQLGLINLNGSNISTINTNINTINLSLSSQTGVNTNITSSISSLNTSVANINSTLSSQLPTFATQTYVGNAISNLIGAAPAALDTLYELANAISNNSNFATTVLNAVANVRTTALSALTTTNSVLDQLIPTLATYVYVDQYEQPLDTTGTLAAIPYNITTTNPYFAGFPKDQLSFTSTGGATATNQNSVTDGNFQLLNFPIVGSTLTFTSSNTKPSQPCVFSVTFKVGNITGFTLSVTYGGVTYGTATFDQNLSATQNTIASLTFTSPAASVASLNFI